MIYPNKLATSKAVRYSAFSQMVQEPVAPPQEGERNDQAVAQLSQGIDRCSPGNTHDGTFTVWRVPNMTGTHQNTASGSLRPRVTDESAADGSSLPGAAAHYWRHEVACLSINTHSLIHSLTYLPIHLLAYSFAPSFPP